MEYWLEIKLNSEGDGKWTLNEQVTHGLYNTRCLSYNTFIVVCTLSVLCKHLITFAMEISD